MREIRLAHSSDVHVDDPLVPGVESGLLGLARVLATASAAAADVVLLAGDTFDNPRVSDRVLRDARDLLAKAARPVVMLPGNHDPALEACLFRRAGLLELPHVRVLGITDVTVLLAELELEIVGLPHRGFSDFAPLQPRSPRRTRWQVVMAHGHYVPPGEAAAQAHRSWRFDDAALERAAADYVALGHWDRPLRVGGERVVAYYSGSPDLARTLNLVRLQTGRAVSVTREPLRDPG